MAPARVKVDRIDLKILSALQAQGRLTNVKLAEIVGLSPSPCFERVKRLEKSGLIKRYLAEVDLSRLARSVTALVEVTLSQHQYLDFQRFERYACANPHVMECMLISGDFDYLIKIIGRDVDHLHAIMEDLMKSDVGVGKHFTYIVMKSVKNSIRYPLECLHEELAPTSHHMHLRQALGA